MNNKELAIQILNLVGGEDNVNQLTNCVTRLRFSLKDESLAKKRDIESLPGVIGAQFQGGQFQVILGGKVVNVAAELKNKYSLGSNDTKNEKKNKLNFNEVINILSSILTPVLPPIIAGGMLQGFIFMFTNSGWVDGSSDTIQILSLISNCMFYFFPFLLASSSAKKFKTNEYMALAIAGALMYPTLINAATLGEITQFSFLGFLSIPVVNYSGSVIPIVLSVLVMKYIYDFLNKWIPEMLRSVFSPLLTLTITIIVSLFALAPLGYYIGEYIAQGIKWLIDFSPIISGFIIGSTRPFLVLLGVHHAMNPIVQQEIASFGSSSMMAMILMSTIAQASAALAIYFIIKDKNTKQIAISSAISGYIGITEPALYGIIIKYKEVMVATFIGGGVGGAISAIMGGKCYGFVMPSILTLPAYMGEGFNGVILGMIATVVVTMGIIILLSKRIREKNDGNDKQIDQRQGAKIIKKAVIYSPVDGELKDIKTISDTTFAEQSIGKGVAVIPNSQNIYSPIDGEIVVSFKTKHAIGLKSKDGVEVLLHVGIDTVNLEGKYFDVKVKEGQYVKQGDLILNFDYKKIEKEGYDPVVLIVVTNSYEYLDVLPFETDGDIQHGTDILSVIY